MVMSRLNKVLLDLTSLHLIVEAKVLSEVSRLKINENGNTLAREGKHTEIIRKLNNHYSTVTEKME